jgi:aminoglycoside 6'-N-acetyltransferase I
LESLTALALELWPGSTTEEMRADLQTVLSKEDAAFFLLFVEGRAIGFAQVSLRYDYVEGTQTSPVGYLEGIYIEPNHRRRGLGRSLVTACEVWVRRKGCDEFASDCELTNEESLLFHLHTGFLEANRIICFAKKV